MSKIHILAGNGGVYNLVIHTATPPGNNAVGNAWKTAALASMLIGSTILSTGSGLGQITTSEATSIVAGDVLEFQAQFPNLIDGSTPTTAQLNAFADAVITRELSRLQVALKFYGYTQG